MPDSIGAQEWAFVCEDLLDRLLPREIGGEAFEVFAFLIYRSIDGGEGARLPREDGLHMLYDCTIIGDALQLSEAKVRKAVRVLAKRGWIRVEGNNGNAIIHVGRMYFGPDGEIDGVELIYDKAMAEVDRRGEASTSQGKGA